MFKSTYVYIFIHYLNTILLTFYVDKIIANSHSVCVCKSFSVWLSMIYRKHGVYYTCTVSLVNLITQNYSTQTLE